MAKTKKKARISLYEDLQEIKHLKAQVAGLKGAVYTMRERLGIKGLATRKEIEAAEWRGVAYGLIFSLALVIASKVIVGWL